MLGDIVLFQADFGFKDSGVARISQIELGGGALLDIGVYIISFASMVFGGNMPSKVAAIGDLFPNGADQQVSISLGKR